MLQENQAEVLTPAEKSRRTRATNKAWADYEKMIEPEYKEYVAALDEHCPIRDGKIAQLDAERMAAISKIEDEFEKRVAVLQDEFEISIKPQVDALETARENGWAVYRDGLLGKAGN